MTHVSSTVDPMYPGMLSNIAVADAITHVSSTIDASHPGMLSNVGVPLVSSVSAGFVL
jgi:hypothetical protein